MNKLRIGVVGAGQMGIGIAQVSAQAKLSVLLFDSNHEQLKSKLSYLHSILSKQVEKGKLKAEDKDAIVNLIRPVFRLEDLRETDFVVEAVKECVDVKASLISSLSNILQSGAILATNTSSISITKLASKYKDPTRVIGMHFMNPVPLMKLVEVINGLQTSAETLKATIELSHHLGKTVTVSKDIPGFIANRLLMPYINEAIYALQEGIASREDIDTTMKLGTNVPMGPLTLADFVGLDTCLAIMKVLHNELGDSKYRPAPLLATYVDAGFLGKKSGRGFYEYK